MPCRLFGVDLSDLSVWLIIEGYPDGVEIAP